jgi:hypothetical protein
LPPIDAVASLFLSQSASAGCTILVLALVGLLTNVNCSPANQLTQPVADESGFVGVALDPEEYSANPAISICRDPLLPGILLCTRDQASISDGAHLRPDS